MEKMTERKIYVAIMEGTLDHDKLVEFCEKKIAALDAKAKKAKERAEAKANEVDELMEIVYGVLTNEPKTLAQIVEAIGREDVTANKVSHRANKLAEAGTIVKTEVKDGKRKLVAYHLPVEE